MAKNRKFSFLVKRYVVVEAKSRVAAEKELLAALNGDIGLSCRGNGKGGAYVIEMDDGSEADVDFNYELEE